MNQQNEMPGMATDKVTARMFLEQEAKAAKKKKSKTADAADEFGRQIVNYSLPNAKRELRFAKGIELPDYPMGRQWRFDYAFEEYKVAVEIEGLVVRRFYELIDPELEIVGGVTTVKTPARYVPVTVMTGRHATVTGFKEDLEKYINAKYLGWDVLRFEQGMVKSKEAIKWTMRILETKGWKMNL